MISPKKRRYATLEVCISTYSRSELSKGERAQEGDIVARREPGNGIGTAEAHNFLWLRISGLEELGLWKLTDIFTDPPTRPEDRPVVGRRYFALFDKRRFCIPLERLKIVAPWLDLNRVRDRSDPYQPFIPIDLDDDDVRLQHTFLVGAAHRPLEIIGLVFDKVTGRYI